MTEPRRAPKILLLIEAALGGAGRHVLDLSAGLLERGYSVHLIHSPLRSDRQFREGLLALQHTSYEFHEQSFPIARSPSPKDLLWWWRLSAYLRRHGPFDAIHAHSTKAGALGRLLTGAGGAVKIYTPHALRMLNPSLSRMHRAAVSCVETALARLCDSILILSEGERQCALQSGLPAAKLALVPNGIDSRCVPRLAGSRQAIRARWGVGPHCVCIGFVGRFCHDKHPELALESFARLTQRSAVPCFLAMIGEGAKEAELKSLAASLGIATRVIWPGPVDGRAHMAAFDLLAHTSRFEGMSYVFLEALAAGVPIVTMRVPGAEELVRPGLTGLICEIRTPETFAENLRGLVEDPGRRAAMADASRQLACQFDLDRMVDQIAALYRIAKAPALARAAARSEGAF